MAGRAPSLIILFILIAFSSFKFSKSFKPCGISVYWGRNVSELSLQEACYSGYYKYVNIAFLITFGGSRDPILDLDGHCDPNSGGCQIFSEDIRLCQGKGIKVLLSIWGILSSRDDAQNVANYLENNFLSGNPGGPLGNVTLDGIDFGFPESPLYWDDLARDLKKFNPNIFLSAAPRCPYPDPNLDSAIKTGLFDYVWVRFYDNSMCDYRSNITSILAEWNKWSWCLPPDNQLFLGLLASPKGGKRFIPDEMVLYQILPVIKSSGNYGGVMLWNRYYDLIEGYGSRIYPEVCSQIYPEVCSHIYPRSLSQRNIELPSEGFCSG